MTNRSFLKTVALLALLSGSISGCNSENGSTTATTPLQLAPVTPATPVACTGVASGTTQSRTQYQAPTPNTSCASEIQTRTCTNGTWTNWSGTFQYPGCTVVYLPCGTTPNGGTVTQIRYQAPTVPFGSTCQPETQTATCNNGSLSAFSGTFQNVSCNVIPPATCGTLASGQTVTRTMFKAASVGFGDTCVSERQTRTCTNGLLSTWSGTFTQDKCTSPTFPGLKRLPMMDETVHNQYISQQVLVGDSLIYTARETGGNIRIYVYSLVNGQTHVVHSTSAGLFDDNPRDLTVVGTKVYFTANSPIPSRDNSSTPARGLFVIDGPSALQTGRFTQIDSSGSSDVSSYGFLTAFNNQLYLAKQNGLASRLQKVDPIAGLSAEPAASALNGVTDLRIFAGKLYFTARVNVVTNRFGSNRDIPVLQALSIDANHVAHVTQAVPTTDPLFLKTTDPFRVFIFNSKLHFSGYQFAPSSTFTIDTTGKVAALPIQVPPGIDYGGYLYSMSEQPSDFSFVRYNTTYVAESLGWLPKKLTYGDPTALMLGSFGKVYLRCDSSGGGFMSYDLASKNLAPAIPDALGITYANSFLNYHNDLLFIGTLPDDGSRIFRLSPQAPSPAPSASPGSTPL